MPHGMSSLNGALVLLVEDENLIAMDFGRVMQKHGAQLLGPAASVEEAIGLIQSNATIDCAVLDVSLHGESAYPVADALEKYGIPYVFATGYGADGISKAYSHVRRLTKPFDPEALVALLTRPA